MILIKKTLKKKTDNEEIKIHFYKFVWNEISFHFYKSFQNIVILY